MVAAIALLAAPLAILLWLSGGVTIFTALAVLLVFVAFVLLAGLLLAHFAGALDMPLTGAWVLGVFASALATYGLVQALHLRAGTAFALWCLLVFVSALAWRRPLLKRPGMPPKEIIGFALCAAATLTWCWPVAEVPSLLSRDGVLYAWVDYFIHGGLISHFGDIRAGRQSMFLADVPAPFYHYASYMLSAALAAPLDLPGLPLATSFWLPLGFLTMCAAAYALGHDLAGSSGAVAALAGITVLPDASNYGLRNGFLSFHWHLATYPGATYAIAIFLVAAVLLRRGLTSAGAAPLLLTLALGAGAFFFRVHLFELGFPALLATGVLAIPSPRRRKAMFLAVSLGMFALFVRAFYAVTHSLPALEVFLDALHGGYQDPTAYSGWYPHLLEVYGRAVAVPIGMLLVFAGCLGVFAVLFPIAALVAHRSWGWRAIDWMPVFLVGTYVLIMLTAPMVHWDSTELTVRPFVLLYAGLAVWTFAWFAKWCAGDGGRRADAVWWWLVLAMALGFVLLWPQTTQLALQPKFQWGWRFYARPVEAGVPEAAAFLRRRSGPGDLFAVQGLPLRATATDLAVQLSSLSGMPAYLGYLAGQMADPGERRQVALQRYALLKRVDGMETREEALARLRQLGLRWYVVPGNHGPRWDPERRRAAFVDRMVAVYEVK